MGEHAIPRPGNPLQITAIIISRAPPKMGKTDQNMNRVGRCKQKSPASPKDVKGRRAFSMSALSLNLCDDDEDGDRSNDNEFSIFHGSDRYTFSPSSGNSLGSPLWSSDSSPLQAAVPFSWEARPGVPNQQSVRGSDSCAGASELRPPPLYFSAGGRSPEPSRSAWAGRRPRKLDDPFLTALVECTKQATKDDGPRKQGYSCMKTCSVRDAQIAVPRSKAAFLDSRRDLGDPEAAGRRLGVHMRSSSSSSSSSSSKSERRSRPGQCGAARGLDSFVRPGYCDNPELIESAAKKRDFKATKAVNQKKQPLTFMEWISCADVELYQSLLPQ